MKHTKKPHTSKAAKAATSSSAEPVYSMIHDKQVAILAQALLREYMHKRGFTGTMSVFDSESPRDCDTVSSRAVMGDLMGLTRDRQEKYKSQGAATIMEMLCFGRIEKRRLAVGIKANVMDSDCINRDSDCINRDSESPATKALEREKKEILAEIEDIRSRKMNILKSLEQQLKDDENQCKDCSESSTSSSEEDSTNSSDEDTLSFLPPLPAPLPPDSFPSSPCISDNSEESDGKGKNKDKSKSKNLDEEKEKKRKKKGKKAKADMDGSDRGDNDKHTNDNKKKTKKKKYLTIDDLLEQEVPVVSTKSGTYDENKNKKKNNKYLGEMDEGGIGMFLQIPEEEAAIARSKKKILLASLNDAESRNGVEARSLLHNKSTNLSNKKKNVHFSDKLDIIPMDNTIEKKRAGTITSSYGAGFSSATAVTPTSTRNAKGGLIPVDQKPLENKITTSLRPKEDSHIKYDNKENNRRGSLSSSSRGSSSGSERCGAMHSEEEENYAVNSERMKNQEEALLRERRLKRESLVSCRKDVENEDNSNNNNKALDRSPPFDGPPVVNRSNGWTSGVIDEGKHSRKLAQRLPDTPQTHGSALPPKPTLSPTSNTTAHNMSPKPNCIGAQLANDLLIRLVGGDRKIPSSFLRQGFYYNKTPEELRIGLVQNEGGPCGVLAVVQAILLSHFVRNHFIVTADVQRTFLLNSLVECLCHCQPDVRRVVVVSPHPRAYPQGLWTPQGKTLENQREYIANQMVMTTDFSSVEALRECVGSYLPLGAFATSESSIPSNSVYDDCPETWSAPNGFGVLSLIISCLLSRGLATVAGTDMDVESPVIVEHGYCSQELVNLLLTGRATSNVHDGVLERGAMLLKGLFPPPVSLIGGEDSTRLPVGCLTHFECKGVVEVGKLGKYPLYPIWVIDNESHYSVAFMKKDTRDVLQSNSNNNNNNNNNDISTSFDIYYYDQHGAQSEEIRLTLHIDGMPLPSTRRDALVPYMNNILRTIPEWRSAKVNWNGTEPLL